MTEPMTPDPIPAIRQRVEKAHGGKPYDIADRNEHAADDLDALLAAWDTQQTALRRLVEEMDIRAAALDQNCDREAEHELALWRSKVAALLPPQAEP